jgi:hypothetical protein
MLRALSLSLLFLCYLTILGSGFILPGKPERALKHEFIPRRGGPPEFRYCQGIYAISPRYDIGFKSKALWVQAIGQRVSFIVLSTICRLQKEPFAGRYCIDASTLCFVSVQNNSRLLYSCYRMQLVNKDSTRHNVVRDVILFLIFVPVTDYFV